MSKSNEVTWEELVTAIRLWRAKKDSMWKVSESAADWLLQQFVITRKPEPLPSEPGTLWLDKDGDVWKVTEHGDMTTISGLKVKDYGHFAPFRRLVVAE